MDVELDDNTPDDEYLTILTETLETAFAQAKPEFVFYLAGADPYKGDRLGHLSLTKPGLEKRDTIVIDQCYRRKIPVAVVLAGGYAPNIMDTVDIYVNTIKTAIKFSQLYKIV